MIVTLTPNPSVDATLQLDDALVPGAVHRAATTNRVAGGKGINVAHALSLAGADSVALFAADENDAFTELARKISLPCEYVPLGASVRTNTTITEPGGRTSKFNGPGPALDAATQQALIDLLSAHAKNADWAVLAGSLPAGVPAQWYAHLIQAARQANPDILVAVDTSDAPLEALYARLNIAAPDVIKPNGLELGQLVGCDGVELERQAEAGDFSGVIAAARDINARGINEVLVTLGGAGAVLVTPQGAWIATPPPVDVKSTVGAGDSALAGYILGRTRGLGFAESLAQSVAYGSAAAGLPGTTIPRPEDLNIAQTTVTAY